MGEGTSEPAALLMTDHDTHPAAGNELLGQRMLTATFLHPVQETKLLETHISWVILTGPWAYKLKKPVRFDFLDYSTMPRRRQYCYRELEANRVWAPEIYQDVVPIFDHAGGLRVGQAGESPAAGERLVDHAVQMRQFPQSALLAAQLKTGAISAEMMERLADDLAALHQRIEAVADRPDVVQQGAIAPALENFDYLLSHLAPHDRDRTRLIRLNTWTQQAITALRPRMQQRSRQGRVRNCHGDLHLENLLYLDGRFRPFDGIEFNDALRQIDVLCELAFVAMELSEAGYRQHAHRLVNRYLEVTEDYAGLTLLPYYLVYRAMVRAKIDLIRQHQSAAGQPAVLASLSPLGQRYLAYAERVVEPAAPQLWITYGPSGSGKSTTAAVLVQQRGFLRLRSDVVRKRLAGREPLDKSPSSQLTSLYAAEMTQRTYQRLQELAQQILSAGYSVVVDATFLQRAQRDAFRGLAEVMGVPLHILHCHAPPEELERRIITRRSDPSDASVTILHSQLQAAQPLAADELTSVVPQRAIDSAD